MTLSQLKTFLQTNRTVSFTLPDGDKVPAHFHITEVGQVTKNFIDCGGTMREEKKINLQLWASVDFHHRLQSDKLLHILKLAEDKLQLVNSEIEVEYQGKTIGKYGLDIAENALHLTNTQTDCLALENCGFPTIKVNLATLKNKASSCCTPGGGCC